MKIAQVVCTYPPYHGGIGAVAHAYTERLRARGHDVHVYTPRYRAVQYDPDYIHRVPSSLHIGNAGVLPSLYQRLKGFDVIHLHYPFFGGAEPVIVRKAIRPDQTLVMTYHMDATAYGLKGVFFEAHRRALLPWIVSRVDRILVSSKNYAASCALAGIPGALDRVEIHPFGVDLDRFHPGSEPEIRSQLGIPEGVPTFLFVGAMDAAHAFKGLSVLFEALRHILGNWHGIIVGEGALRASYMEEANHWPFAERLHFVGRVTEEALPAYYRAADVHVFPSTERAEAFGLVALEAAASGIPTIASDLSGVRSVVLDGVTGLLVSPKDAVALQKTMEDLLVHTELREKLGLAARKRTEVEFAWGPLVSRLEETYRRLRPV